MVIQKTVNNLKERPRDERKAVAGGLAIMVVIILLLGWAIFFFKKLQRDAVKNNFGSNTQLDFDLASIREGQQQLLQGSAGGDSSQSETNQFGNSGAVE
jgi:hypothetical protein